jgi:hypothetical protein
MGKMAYALRLIAGLTMALSLIAVCGSFSDAMDNLGRPGGDRALGALLLTTLACFLVAFLCAGVLWVLTDISQQLERPAQTQTTSSAEFSRRAS